MLDARRLVSVIFGTSYENVPLLVQQLPDNAVNNARTGLRRWVIRSNHYSSNPQELVDWVWWNFTMTGRSR
ncbi:hypothetical protein P3102_18170 [Amycolatopsis sp. QT-25]|uniref:hypothetical protein n=1 Tax=Amycolatopsis sp. QT-25 TaxID=3034022 RepID=UPI0023EABE39|nr:hypothetical protein [Amycolatopsis sp. QT-25]WET82993.1 hypothetical protein P3102_18170 [Amycolatopsis sp. QT-25]